MVVGPISQLKHIATGIPIGALSIAYACSVSPAHVVKNLLDRWKRRFHEKAVLVVVRPVKVENRNGDKQFYGFTPPTR
jgi:hypothetical protein